MARGGVKNIRRTDARPRPSAATTFPAAEVDLLDEIVKALLRGADTRVLARAPALAGVARKVAVMKASVDGRRRPSLRVPVSEPTPLALVPDPEPTPEAC